MMQISKSLFITVLCFGFLASCLKTDEKTRDSINKITEADRKVSSERWRVFATKRNISEASAKLVLKLVKKEQIPEADIKMVEGLYKDLSEAEKALEKAEKELYQLVEKAGESQ